MKVGIVLTGISFLNIPNAVNRDWRLNKDNLNQNLINSFARSSDVSLYMTTYNHPSLPELLDFYKPKKSLILPFESAHQRTTYIESMKQLITEDLDFIVSTRFDIHFNSRVNEWYFDYDKFNFIFREIEPHWTNDQFTGDVLYGFPKKYLASFIESITREHQTPYRDGPDLHPVYRHLSGSIGLPNINFLFEGTHNSNRNPFYDLVRS